MDCKNCYDLLFLSQTYGKRFGHRHIKHERPCLALFQNTKRNIFDELRSVWKCVQTLSLVVDYILQPYNIRVAHNPTIMFRHLLTNVKYRDEPNNRQVAVYKIKCSDCQASYIGLTYSTNYFQRLTLESWYTNLKQTPLNRCQQLPASYKRLIRDKNETDKRTSNRPA